MLIPMDDVLTAETLAPLIGPMAILRECRVFAELDSTNTYLRARAGREAEGLVVVAEYQTAGRGRQGRSWVAPPGSAIHCSVLLRPRLPREDLYLLTAACALAVRDALAPLTAEQPRLKWPNDVLLGERKVCGILTETARASRGAPRAVVGFGVNMYAAPDPAIAPHATCVADHALRRVSRLAVLADILRRYDALLAALYGGGTDAVWREWRVALATLGRRVRVRGADGFIEGHARDVARDGALILETTPGTRPIAVYAGEAIEQPGEDE
jgi:BirA family biotin operon repressor/biotin-[acetyl-CoA-carboxylase] ligase